MFPWNILPFNKDMKNMMQQMNPQEIETYVQDMMKKMMPQQMDGGFNPQDIMKGMNPLQSDVGVDQSKTSSHTSSPLNASVYETHDYVYARIPIKQRDWLNQLRIYHTSNQLIIEHIPELNDKQTITLPTIVKKKGSTAHFKDETLEVKMPKNIDLQYSEIDVNEIL
ncbi:Hsp20/alpha crystallin family protein [Cytobacillus spongiae]|jgi:HSP20 family molecular chaperone IbpA|uniref:Hsp20/alpha crystallin family protein n=1 Tax=Cytobacillus spongiae TaxID=2901381 RepID=UPI001F319300|nr:Hsp20/alpha crystallin family protein [Cytobacillus spongiae]UII54446.1 Hsp20/alpha crystallin family protein [Cytobacillus spongiae]